MCGITVLWGRSVTKEMLDASILALKARGPDAVHAEIIENSDLEPIGIGFSRLHIQGTSTDCEQPFYLPDARFIICNGEIFNSKLLIESLNLTVPEGASDCAVIPAMLEKGLSLAEVCRQLDGDFAIVVVDLADATVTVARDPYGVRPLYLVDGGLVSEIKATPEGACIIKAVEPGTIITINTSDGTWSEERWHQVPWLKNPYLSDEEAARNAIHAAMIEAVKKRLTTVRDLGACLSGGLDSSLVAALATQITGPIHTYSIGMADSPDLMYARLVAGQIRSIHHECIITPEECLAAVPAVIRAIETCDITSIRASVGNYLLGRFIAQETPSVKVVLNGDGADEALGGYLYMRAAPSDMAFETETTRLLTEIHRYDVARSERSMAAHGLESRSPFLDRQLIAVFRGISTKLLRPTESNIEKLILRAAFNDENIPKGVLWRPKEAFSDGISSARNSWFTMAAAEGERLYPNWSSTKYTVNPPQTAEAYWYREEFHKVFPEDAVPVVTPAMWMPRFVNATDPSARTLEAYKNT
jgi:asparagine synthase (glutamine-hydrolysing)